MGFEKYSPCGNHCNKRHLGCQATCPDMLEAQKAWEAEKQMIRKKKDHEMMVDEFLHKSKKAR